MEDNYIPYGPEWEKEMMKMPKKLLIEMIRKAKTMEEKKSLAELLLEYALSQDATKLHLLPGLWESRIDDHWLVKCNRHEETINNLPPFSWYIEYNGWPAGIMGIRGDGVICAGEAANEQTLMAAILKKMNAIR